MSGDASEAEGAALAAGAAVQLLRPVVGAVVLEEGAEGDAMYRVVRGRVAVKKTDGERTITLATLGAGETFGEMSLFGTAHRRSASVIALDDGTELERIDPAAFRARLAADPNEALKDLERLITSLSDRLAHTNASLVALMRIGEHCAAAVSWESVAKNLTAALRLAIPALSPTLPSERQGTATFWRYNPYAEDHDLLASSGPARGTMHGAAPDGDRDPGLDQDPELGLEGEGHPNRDSDRAPAAAPPSRSSLRADTAEGCHLRVDSPISDAFTEDDQALLDTAAVLAAGTLRRLSQQEDQAAQSRLAAARSSSPGRGP